MIAKTENFTIQELESISGFDRRTIAYYVHEGLLPGVGRRGRGTVYPAAFKHKLMFIRVVRDLQDAGALRAVTLAETKAVMEQLKLADIQRLQTGQEDAIRALFQDPDWDTSKLVVPVEVVVESRGKKRGRSNHAELRHLQNSNADTELAINEADLSVKQIIDLIESKIAKRAASTAADQQLIRTTFSTQLSDNLRVSVEGLDDEHSSLLQLLVFKLHALN